MVRIFRIELIPNAKDLKGQVLSVLLAGRCVGGSRLERVGGLEVGRVRSLDFILSEIGTVGWF